MRCSSSTLDLLCCLSETARLLQTEANKGDRGSIWFLYFVNAFQLSVSSSLNPYVTSSFQAHSLSALPTAIGDAFAAATYLPMAKLMDVWGRAEGFLFMVLCLTLGLVLMAACNSFEAYCAANVSRKESLSGSFHSAVPDETNSGPLLCWVIRNGICDRRRDGRCLDSAKSSVCVRLHLFSLYYHSLCGTKSGGRVLLSSILEMGFWGLGDCYSRCRTPAVRNPEIQLDEGTKRRIPSEETQRSDGPGEHPALVGAVRL